MNLFKTISCTFLCSNLLFSCFSNTKENNENGFFDNQEPIAMNKTETNSSIPKGYQFNPVYDHDNGMVMCQVPMPTTWSYFPEKEASIIVKGPNNLKVFKSDLQVFAYATDDFALQSLYQNQMNMKNTKIAPVRSFDQMVQEKKNYFEQNKGMDLMKTYSLPKYLAFMERFKQGVVNIGTQTKFEVIGSDWKDNNGKKYFVLFFQTVNKRENFIDWRFNTTVLEVSEAGFEQSKKEYIYGLENTQINMEWQRTMNNQVLQTLKNNDEYWKRATEQLLVGHQQRMADINARGNAALANAKTYSDILDINHAGYLNRSNIVSAMQSNTVDMIHERITISNVASGERYQVDQGSKYYWVNANGQYIGTDNSFYDPRIDKSINNEQWTPFEIEN